MHAAEFHSREVGNAHLNECGALTRQRATNVRFHRHRAIDLLVQEKVLEIRVLFPLVPHCVSRLLREHAR